MMKESQHIEFKSGFSENLSTFVNTKTIEP